MRGFTEDDGENDEYSSALEQVTLPEKVPPVPHINFWRVRSESRN